MTASHSSSSNSHKQRRRNLLFMPGSGKLTSSSPIYSARSVYRGIQGNGNIIISPASNSFPGKILCGAHPFQEMGCTHFQRSPIWIFSWGGKNSSLSTDDQFPLSLLLYLVPAASVLFFVPLCFWVDLSELHLHVAFFDMPLIGVIIRRTLIIYAYSIITDHIETHIPFVRKKTKCRGRENGVERKDRGFDESEGEANVKWRNSRVQPAGRRNSKRS